MIPPRLGGGGFAAKASGAPSGRDSRRRQAPVAAPSACHQLNSGAGSASPVMLNAQQHKLGQHPPHCTLAWPRGLVLR